MNEQEIENWEKEFDIWYKDQKEMNPYIIRDYFLEKFQEYKSSLRAEIELKKGKSPRHNVYPEEAYEGMEDYKNGWDDACADIINQLLK